MQSQEQLYQANKEVPVKSLETIGTKVVKLLQAVYTTQEIDQLDIDTLEEIAKKRLTWSANTKRYETTGAPTYYGSVYVAKDRKKYLKARIKASRKALKASNAELREIQKADVAAGKPSVQKGDVKVATLVAVEIKDKSKFNPGRVFTFRKIGGVVYGSITGPAKLWSGELNWDYDLFKRTLLSAFLLPEYPETLDGNNPLFGQVARLYFYTADGTNRYYLGRKGSQIGFTRYAFDSEYSNRGQAGEVLFEIEDVKTLLRTLDNDYTIVATQDWEQMTGEDRVVESNSNNSKTEDPLEKVFEISFS